MAAILKPEIVSREIVKPSYATPLHKRIHTLSLFDQLSPGIYMPLVFFHPKGLIDAGLLKKSLSSVLSSYYPLAGRIRDNFTIDCNDEGVVYLEARIKCELSGILKHPEDENMKQLFPDDLHYKDSSLRGPLAVQVTFFSCGGTAIALCISHKVLDMEGMCFFINQWASFTRNSSQQIPVAEFNIGSVYPHVDLPITKFVEPQLVKCASRRILFPASKIAELKSLAADKFHNPTRVEVVTGLIYSCMISAARARSGLSKPTVLNLAANVRKRVVPPISESFMGNLTGTFPISTGQGSKLDLHLVVGEIRKEKTEFFHSCAKKASREEFCLYVLKCSEGARESCYDKNQDVYMCSPWCRYPFYEADFGWGKPIWVTPTFCEIKNVVMMMDTKDGSGIEAYVTLEEGEMTFLEQDEELLAFGLINPRII